MNKVEVKFGDWIEKGINLYKANLGILVVGSLLALLVSGVSLGILGGPMMAGLTMIVLALNDGTQPKPQGTDVFKGFSLFGPSFVYFLLYGIAILICGFVLGMIPCVGPLLSAFSSWAVMTAGLFAICNIVDKKMGAVDAFKASLAVVKTNFWMFLAFGVVANLIGGIGFIACGIGIIFTIPISACMVVVAYRDVCAQQAAPVGSSPA